MKNFLYITLVIKSPLFKSNKEQGKSLQNLIQVLVKIVIIDIYLNNQLC